MSIVQSLYNKVVRNEDITRTEALRLYSQPLAELCTAADEIRKLSAKTILIFAQFSVLKAETAARTVNSVLNHPIASHLSIHMLYFLTMKSSIKLKRIMKMVLHAIP